jgi:hypothetical protein
MTHKMAVDLQHYHEPLLATLSHKQMIRLLKAHLKDDGSVFGFDDLILAYQTFAGSADLLEPARQKISGRLFYNQVVLTRLC